MAPWKRLADEWHAKEVELYLGNFTEAQKRQGWNYSKQSLAMKEANGMAPVEVAFDMGTMYEAGTDTTTMALEVFVLAAVLNPGFVKKAQKELDQVVGLDTLPSFDHRPTLPYINATVSEVLRWRPVSAGGIPHAVSQDDEYMGYHIPKGTTVIGNHWSISLDDDVFDEPYEFRPDRWIKNTDLPQPGFCFGRRVCTGQHVARNSLFINISRLLWAFDIGHAVEDGKEVPVDSMAMTQGFNSRPMPFKASFRIREPGRKAVIEKAWADAEKDVEVILNRIGQSK
jgi:cytochrome P450